MTPKALAERPIHRSVDDSTRGRGKGETMSRSEQLHDASMEEILAAIRKIITDDGPDAADLDAFSSAAVDDFREASAALARSQPGGYMNDLARALAGRPPVEPTDDDILDSGTAGTSYGASAAAHRDESALAPAASTEAFRPAADEDVDLFEADMPSVDRVVAEPLTAAPGEDEEVIDDLGDPIMLGPEIELVEETRDDTVPVRKDDAAPNAATEATGESVSDELSAAAGTIEAMTLPPPPPPVVSAEVESTETALAALAEAVISEAIESEAAAADPAEVTPDEPSSNSPDEAAVEEIAAEVEAAIDVSEEPSAAATEDVASAAELGAGPAETASADETEFTADSAADFAFVETAPAGPDVDAEAPPEPAVEPATDAAAPAGSPTSAASLAASEEMVAAMLKPMLKEWLDANMPRIVAKAMGGKDEDGSPAA
jgi:cell pole-organizing protein PopZ